MKELANEFEGEFNCVGESTEKYKTFSVIITKEVERIYKNGKEITKNIFCKLKFIDSARFKATLSNLVNNLAEEIYQIKCKHEHENKKCEMFRFNYIDCKCCLQYTNVKYDLIK